MTEALLVRNGQVLDVFSGQWHRSDIAVSGGRFTGWRATAPTETVDATGCWIIPGLIDTHVHIESSQLCPAAFARAVLPHGTTRVIADPHEMANVLGLEGVRYMIEAAKGTPLRIHIMAPSCVPASPFETSGARLDAADVATMLSWEGVLGLGEMMNFPGVIARDPDVMAKLDAARGRPIDGHAPGLSGEDLAAYIAAGPRTDHESTTLSEAKEKLRAGMHLLIREGSGARNLAELLPLLTEAAAPFIHFCTDDRHAEMLLAEGHIDGMLRTAMARGIPAQRAISASTIHAARAYGLEDVGAIAPGYQADFVVLSSLDALTVREVFVGGRRVAQEGTCIAACIDETRETVRKTMNVVLPDAPFRVAAGTESYDRQLRVIGVSEGQFITAKLRVSPSIRDGEVVADPDRDLVKVAVIDRHHGSGSVGLGWVQGFGLRHGALASTVAHDSHNLVVIGADDHDMAIAARLLTACGGGQIAVRDGRPLALLELPIAGLMSDRPAADVARAQRDLHGAAQALGCSLSAPFMVLSFLALPVIPHLKITDQGLVDVERFARVPMWTEGADA